MASECAKPGTYTLEDVLKPHALEERVYRLRCVALGLWGLRLLLLWCRWPFTSPP